MKLTLHSTQLLAEIDGVPARIWEGTSEAGVPVVCWITRIAVDRDHDCSEFDRELQEHAPPGAMALQFPLRLTLREAL